jgi:Fic family protein
MQDKLLLSEPVHACSVPQDWAVWLQEQEGQMEIVALAALAHHKLVAIHPFLDGNGRTARLIMNLVLRAGYPRPLSHASTTYYRVLAQADCFQSATWSSAQPNWSQIRPFLTQPERSFKP